MASTNCSGSIEAQPRVSRRASNVSTNKVASAMTTARSRSRSSSIVRCSLRDRFDGLQPMCQPVDIVGTFPHRKRLIHRHAGNAMCASPKRLVGWESSPVPLLCSPQSAGPGTYCGATGVPGERTTRAGRAVKARRHPCHGEWLGATRCSHPSPMALHRPPQWARPVTMQAPCRGTPRPTTPVARAPR